MDTAASVTLDQFKQRLEQVYSYIRGVIQPGYIYNNNPAFDKAFIKAAKFCLERGLTPEEYAYGVLYSLESSRQATFYPNHFGSHTTNEGVLAYKQQKAIPVEDIFEQQKYLLLHQTYKLKNDLHDVLMNPRLPFYAWFRILMSATPDFEIINTYSETAREEMTPEIRAFLIREKFDLNRIL
jgi:hypothetical protein